MFRLLSLWLARPRAHVVIALVACALLAPSVTDRLVLDDHVLALKARTSTGLAGLAAEPLWLFTFTTGRPADNQALMDQGVLLPWWSDPQHLNSFLRPLSSLSHVLDFALWPSSPRAMHVHSLLWYLALLLTLAHVYRRLDSGPAWLATFALLLYAFDDAHAATVAWVANRNALLAATLALPALSAHHRYRAEGFAAGAVLGPLCFALGLLAGETAISVLGYLGAYALCLDRGPLRARLTALWPYLLLLACHRVLYRVLGLGSFGSGAYHDPAQEPLGFVLALAYNLPVLLSAQLGGPPADLAFWGDPAQRMPLFALAAISVAVIAWLCARLLKEDRQARFWALGMLLAAVPVSASLPGERLLLVVSVGAAPLLARLFARTFLADAEHASQTQSARALERLLVLGLLFVHLVAAPLAMPVRARSMEWLGAALDRADESVPRTDAITAQTLVVVNAPFNVMASYLQVARENRGQPRPAHVHWLSSASSELQVRRSAANRLQLSLHQGFLYRPEETHYRGELRGLGVGAQVQLSELGVRVSALTPDGRPKSVECTFKDPLEAPRYRFVVYRDGRFEPWPLPAVGEVQRFAAADFFDVIASELFR